MKEREIQSKIIRMKAEIYNASKLFNERDILIIDESDVWMPFYDISFKMERLINQLRELYRSLNNCYPISID